MMGNRIAPSPQPLPEDRILDILLRLPPDDPAGIVRASAVCKAWRRIITDPTFAGRYRALHPTAPVLGFLHRPRNNEPLPRFVSTTSFRPAAADHRQSPLDCRHGRAVFYDYGSIGSYVVWDPATGELHKLPEVPGDEYLPHAAVVRAAGGGCDHRGCSGGPFIVAFVGIEHIDFLGSGDDDDEEMTEEDDNDDEDKDVDVDDDDEEMTGEDDNEDEDEDEDVDVDDDDEETTDKDDEENEDVDGMFVDAHACFYASDTGELTGEIDIHLERRYDLDQDRPAALVGDSLYYLCWPGILRYRYGLLRRLGTMGMSMTSAGIKEGDVLSMIDLPRGEHRGIGKKTDMVIMAAEGGGVGLAYLCHKTGGTMLHLLAMETEAIVGGSGRGWVQRRVIDLKTLLPIGNPKRKPCLTGIAQDTNVIFVSTKDGVFSIDLSSRSSLQARKVCEIGVVDRWMHPFVSFYTESLLLKLASGRLPASVGNQ